MARSRYLVLLALALVVPAMSIVGVPPAAATLPSKPELTLDRIVRTTPFAGGTREVDDVEGIAYVARDDAVWLADDNGNALYEVDAESGKLRRTIGAAEFSEVPPLGGGELATLPRFDDLESLAYDTANDRLYVFSGSCCTTAVQPTAFRMDRVDGDLELDSYQPLTKGTEFTAAGWNPDDRKLYVGSGSQLQTYDFATNTPGVPIKVGGLSGILGLDFTDDGKDLFVAHSDTVVSRVRWATKARVPDWDLQLARFDVRDARGVEVVDEQLWVPDGASRPSTDPNDRAVFVFDVGGTGSTPAPPPPSPPPPAPTASFTASATSGTAPLAVTFADTSTGGPTAWSWDFGDGATAGTQTATHTYAAAGSYTVRLTVENAGGASSTTVGVQVAPAPAPPPPPQARELVGNPGFESGLAGWRSASKATTLERVRGGHSGAWAARVTGRGDRRTVGLEDARRGWAGTTATGTYTASVWVRTKDVGARLVLRLVERRSGKDIGTVRTKRTLTRGWQQVQVGYVARAPGASRLDLAVVLHGTGPKAWFKADDVSLRVS
ncbi:PKD domain-containing protein [Nocardioides iriomotensis]|nr:PKD domain-containing protein [Nocardioides iriomotensis]